jgi:Zn-dependent protease with chaperone function
MLTDRNRDLGHELERIASFYTPRALEELFLSGGLYLYVLTLVGEIPVIFVRWFLWFAILNLVELAVSGHFVDVGNWSLLALIPTAWSVLSVAGVWGGGWWWAQGMGGREPSERERAAYEEAISTLKEHGGAPIAEPTSWFVLDLPEPDASVCGHSLALSRGLLESTYLEPVLAHELGHLGSPDGRITAAINRLMLLKPREAPPLPEDHAQAHDAQRLVVEHRHAGEWDVDLTLGFMKVAFLVFILFIKGGVALRLMGPLWARYWREREYAADAYAAKLGQGAELAEFLETYALRHDRPIPFLWLTQHTHPPTELRIDRLTRADDAPAAGMETPPSAPGQES